MNAKFNPRITLGSVIFFAFIALLVSYLTAGSLNPLSVYASHSTVGKVIVSAAGFFVALGLLGLLQYWAAMAYIRRTAKKPAGDVICPGCGLALLKFAAAYGRPIRCPGCKTWWHYGLNCFKKGAAGRRIVIGCPNCRAVALDDTDSFAADGLSEE